MVVLSVKMKENLTENEQTMTADKKIRVLVIDDSEVMRHSLRQVLSAFNDLQWVGESSDGQDALDLCAEVHPDVILVDVGLVHVDVAKLTYLIRTGYTHTQVIGITSFEDKLTINQVLQAGAVLCLSKNTSVAQIADSVRQVAQATN